MNETGMENRKPAGGTRTGRPRARRPDLETLYTINEDGSRNFLHPADVHGKWQVRKNIVWALLLAFYVLLPWITIQGAPAVHIDIPGRVAHLFGFVFTSQDFYLVFFLISGMGFALFFVTSLWGRVWCGYACPQTVFLEGVFRRIERWIEGPGERRIRRNQGPLTLDRFWRKAVKLSIFLALAYVTAHVFLSYFIPVKELLEVVRSRPGAHPTAFFWSMFWTAVLFFDFTWFREQTCLIICPYGRLQSTLVDADTITIGYDRQRGEPRGRKLDSGGDCVDCFRCVAVCPTGIDIRNGVQMECVGCTNCIDACDAIMEKVDKPKGLIRYDSERGFETGKRRSLLRPRFAIYLVLLLIGASVFTAVASRRTPLEVTLLRPQGLPFRIHDGRIENQYTLHVQNKSTREMIVLVETTEDPGMQALEDASGDPVHIDYVVPRARLALPSLGDSKIPLFATMARTDFSAPFEHTIVLVDSLTGVRREFRLPFRGP